MLREQPWLKVADGLAFELFQAEEEGKDVSAIRERVNRILEMDPSDPTKERLAASVYDEIQALPVMKGYKYSEPSSLAGIKAERPVSKLVLKVDIHDDDELFEKIYGAWMGRCAGCLLGQPVEGWKRERIKGLLAETGNYPVKYYISSDIPDEIRFKYGVTDEGSAYGSDHINWINNVSYMPEDDDINYTIIGMKIMEEYGEKFTPDDVAECWLQNLPILHTCTAERVAYRNLVNCIYPPESATFRNPYREWIGAQIRADFYGYVTPGNPELGAEFAWRDASISHIKNGLYGAMFVAAMLSAAFTCDSIDDVINAGLSQIPANCRLAEQVNKVVNWKKSGANWEDAVDRIHEMYDENNPHHWCHVIPNAMIVCAGLLYGEMNFEKTIGITLQAAFDTDCNCATAGSVVGMLLGARSLPEKWTKPLNDQVRSGVDGFGLVKISELAARTMRIAKSINKQI